jgi:hypothetical protein
MTTKQIAEAVGQTERSVQMWAKKAGEKISSINEKISSASPRYPADYTMAETCLIIEEGLGKAAADVYRTNAAQAELALKPVPAAQRLPSGAQMNAMARIYGANEAGRIIKQLIGIRFPEENPEPVGAGAVKREIMRQTMGAAHAIASREIAKAERDLLQGRLL